MYKIFTNTYNFYKDTGFIFKKTPHIYIFILNVENI